MFFFLLQLIEARYGVPMSRPLHQSHQLLLGAAQVFVPLRVTHTYAPNSLSLDGLTLKTTVQMPIPWFTLSRGTLGQKMNKTLPSLPNSPILCLMETAGIGGLFPAAAQPLYI